MQNNNEFNGDNISLIYNSFFGGEKELTTECIKCLNLNENKEQNEVEKLVENKDLYYLMFSLNNVLDFLKYNKNKDNNIINIYDCLNFFEIPKVVEQNNKVCNTCGFNKFLITSKIKKCQNNLLILLNKNFNNEEKDDDIKFELSEILEMKNFIKNGNEINQKLIYELYAIICLNITFEENQSIIHHVAFCKSPVNGKWYKYDDNIVEPVTNLQNEVEEKGMPVALFYQKSEIN